MSSHRRRDGQAGGLKVNLEQWSTSQNCPSAPWLLLAKRDIKGKGSRFSSKQWSLLRSPDEEPEDIAANYNDINLNLSQTTCYHLNPPGVVRC